MQMIRLLQWIGTKTTFKNLGIFFSGKQQGAVMTDQKIYSQLTYNFCMVVRIFQVATSLSKFSATRPSLA